MDVDKHSVVGGDVEGEAENSNVDEDSDMSGAAALAGTEALVISDDCEALAHLPESEAPVLLDPGRMFVTGSETSVGSGSPILAGRSGSPMVVSGSGPSSMLASGSGGAVLADGSKQPMLASGSKVVVFPGTSETVMHSNEVDAPGSETESPMLASGTAEPMSAAEIEEPTSTSRMAGRTFNRNIMDPPPGPNEVARFFLDASDGERSNLSTAESDSMANIIFDHSDSNSDAGSAHVSLRMDTTQGGESPTHYRLVLTQSRREDIGTLRGFDEVNVLPARLRDPMDIGTPPRAITPFSADSDSEEPNIPSGRLQEESVADDGEPPQNSSSSRILNGRPRGVQPPPEAAAAAEEEGEEEAANEEEMDAADEDEQSDASSEESSNEEDFADNNYMPYNPENLGFFGQHNIGAHGPIGMRQAAGPNSQRVRGNGPANLEPRTWFVSNPRVRVALRNVMLEARRDNEGVGHYLGRGNVLQNLRRMLFIGSHQNRSEGSGNAESNSSDDAPDPAQRDPTENEEAVNNDESSPPQEILISFDRNLPAEHSYMGSNMDRVSGVEYLEPGQSYRLMLFMHEHILFPGEILPFMIHSYVIDRSDDQTGLLFGICFPGLHGPDEAHLMYGVTCHVYERGSNENGQSLFKSRALQRFVIETSAVTGVLQPIANSYAKAYGKVKVLPEHYLSDPLKTMRMGSISRFRDVSAIRESYRRFQLASTPVPFHAYDKYNIDHVIEKARNVLAAQKLETMPNDPIKQSFWLMRNLHLSDDLIRKAFITNSVNRRMQLIETSFVQNAHFACRFCAKKIADCSELFAMSKHGVQTQYCNSAGYIHQTNTVYNLCRNAVTYSGRASSEFSWFPGYEWQIIVCKRCSHHIGWKFRAEQPELEPKTFFAITSSSVRVTTSNSESSERIPLSRMILSYVATLMDPE